MFSFILYVLYMNYVTNIFSKTNLISSSTIKISLSQSWTPLPWTSVSCVVSRVLCCGTTGTAQEDWPLLGTPGAGSRSPTALVIEAEGWQAARSLTLKTDCWCCCSLKLSYIIMSWATTLHRRRDNKRGDMTNKSTSRVNDTNVGPLGKGAVGTMVDPTNIVALVGQGQRTKNQLWCASCLTQDLWMASLNQ